MFKSWTYTSKGQCIRNENDTNIGISKIRYYFGYDSINNICYAETDYH